MMKTVAAILVALGVGIAGAMASRLPAQIEADNVLKMANDLRGESAPSQRLSQETANMEERGAMADGDRLSSWFQESGLGLVMGFAFIVIGGVIARRQVHAEVVAADKGGAQDFGVLLEQVRTTAVQVAEGCSSEPDPQMLRDKIEALEDGPLGALVGARLQIKERYGLAAMANIIGDVSTAERRLNRAWSALTDGHRPEAKSSAEGAVAALALAKEHLDAAVRNA